MIQFIEQHGTETVEKIKKQMADEFTIQKNSYVEEKKKEITENLKNQLANQEVQLKIEKSKEQNAQRIERMKLVNKHVENLRKETRAQVTQ